MIISGLLAFQIYWASHDSLHYRRVDAAWWCRPGPGPAPTPSFAATLPKEDITFILKSIRVENTLIVLAGEEKGYVSVLTSLLAKTTE